MKGYKVKKINNDKITIKENKEKKSIGFTVYILTMSVSVIIFLIILGITMSKMLFSTDPIISSEKLDIEVTYDEDISNEKDIIRDIQEHNYIKTYVNNSNTGGDLSFIVKNNNNKKYKYRIVIEESEKSTLKNDFIKYSIKINNKQYRYNTDINEKKWTNNSQLDKETYILYESELDSDNSIEVNLNISVDYSKINNNSQNKYWYGTIKVYAWEG